MDIDPDSAPLAPAPVPPAPAAPAAEPPRAAQAANAPAAAEARGRAPTLGELLRRFDKKLKNGDGDCFFSCVADALTNGVGGPTERAEVVRLRVLLGDAWGEAIASPSSELDLILLYHWLTANERLDQRDRPLDPVNRDDVALFWLEDVDRIDLEGAKERMKLHAGNCEGKPLFWADESTVALLASKLSIAFLIFQKRGNGSDALVTQDRCILYGNRGHRTLALLCTDNRHYDLLLPKFPSQPGSRFFMLEDYVTSGGFYDDRLAQTDAGGSILPRSDPRPAAAPARSGTASSSDPRPAQAAARAGVATGSTLGSSGGGTAGVGQGGAASARAGQKEKPARPTSLKRKNKTHEWVHGGMEWRSTSQASRAKAQTRRAEKRAAAAESTGGPAPMNVDEQRGPAEPSKREQPAEAAEPEQRAKRAKTEHDAERAEPAEPEHHAETANSNQAGKLAKPEQPTKPKQPAKAKNKQPKQPAKAKAKQPSAPAKPAARKQPDKSTEPVQPNKPVEPVQTVLPEEPAAAPTAASKAAATRLFSTKNIGAVLSQSRLSPIFVNLTLESLRDLLLKWVSRGWEGRFRPR